MKKLVEKEMEKMTKEHEKGFAIHLPSNNIHGCECVQILSYVCVNKISGQFRGIVIEGY